LHAGDMTATGMSWVPPVVPSTSSTRWEERMTCRAGVSLLALLAFPALGCGSVPGDEYLKQAALIEDPDGRLSYYSGSRVADKLARGEDPEDVHNLNSFMRVRVPPAMLQDAGASPFRRKIISLEQPYAGFEILHHEADDASFRGNRATRMKNTRYVPGQPWLSGHAILRILDDGTSYAGVHLIAHSGTLPMSGADISWGMTGCRGEPDCPTLRFASPDPCDWPPLPPGWVLVPLMGQAADLDVICHRR
jgi:hypothetical protein